MSLIAKGEAAQQRSRGEHDHRPQQAGQPTPTPQHLRHAGQGGFVPGTGLRDVAHGTLPQSQSRKGRQHLDSGIVKADDPHPGRTQPQGDALIAHDGTEYRKHLHAAQEAGRLHNATIHRCRFALLHQAMPLEGEKIGFIHDATAAKPLFLGDETFVEEMAVVAIGGSEIEIAA